MAVRATNSGSTRFESSRTFASCASAVAYNVEFMQPVAANWASTCFGVNAYAGAKCSLTVSVAGASFPRIDANRVLLDILGLPFLLFHCLHLMGALVSSGYATEWNSNRE